MNQRFLIEHIKYIRQVARKFKTVKRIRKICAICDSKKIIYHLNKGYYLCYLKELKTMEDKLAKG